MLIINLLRYFGLLFLFVSCKNSKSGIGYNQETKLINEETLNDISLNNSTDSSFVLINNQLKDKSICKPAIYYVKHTPKIGDQKMLMGKIFNYKTGDGYSYWECTIKRKKNKPEYRLIEYPNLRLISSTIYSHYLGNSKSKDTLYTVFTDKIIYFDSTYRIAKEINLDSLNPYLKNDYNKVLKLHYFDNEGGAQSELVINPKLEWEKLIDEYWINVNVNFEFGKRNMLVTYSLTSFNYNMGILNTENNICVYDDNGNKLVQFNKIYGNLVRNYISTDGSLMGIVQDNTYGDQGFVLYSTKDNSEILSEKISSDYFSPIIYDWRSNEDLLIIRSEGFISKSDMKYRIINILKSKRKVYEKYFDSKAKYHEYTDELLKNPKNCLKVLKKFKFNLIKSY